MNSKFSFKILFWIVTKSSPTLVELYNWSWTQNYVLMKMWRFSRFLFEWRSEESPEDWVCESRVHQCERVVLELLCTQYVRLYSQWLLGLHQSLSTHHHKQTLAPPAPQWMFLQWRRVYLPELQANHKVCTFINSEIFPIYLVLAPSVGNEQHPSCNCFLTREKIFNFN